MTASKVVDAISPDLNKPIHITMNSERWFHIVNGALNVPPDQVLRTNFQILDKLIEKLKQYERDDIECPIWDDNAIKGTTYYTEEDCLKGIDFLMTKKVLSVDIESRHAKWTDNKILLLGFAYSETEAMSFAPPGIDSPKVRASFEKLLTRNDCTYIYQNGKFDTARIKWIWGIDSRVDEDTMLKHYIGLNERKGTHSLDDLGMLYLGCPNWSLELEEYKDKWCSSHKILKKQFMYDMIPLEILIPYNYKDCCVTFRLAPLFEQLMRPETKWMYNKLIEASNVYRDIELRGNLIDENYLYWLLDDLDSKIIESEKAVKKLSDELWDPQEYAADKTEENKQKWLNTPLADRKVKYTITKAPKEFNYGSPAQLKWILEKATGAKLTTTNKDALNDLAEQYPEASFLQSLMDLRRWNKYMDTYVQGIQDCICEDGRVRCTFNLHGTETGRLSCKEPNMQNIPRSPYIKNIFIAPEGRVLIQCDYSQAELRVLAFLSQDPNLKGIYLRGEDLHDAMALQIFGEGFSKEDRVGAKTVNFGIPYGRGPQSIAYKLKMKIDRAKFILNEWFKINSTAKKWLDERRAEPFRRNTSPYRTVFGRQRSYVITSENKNHIGNQAVNFPISSLASDLTMLSVLEIAALLKEECLDAYIVNTVHDSIIIEANDDQETKAAVARIASKVMAEMAPKYLEGLDFPFKADVEFGRSWGDMEHEDSIFEQEDIS